MYMHGVCVLYVQSTTIILLYSLLYNIIRIPDNLAFKILIRAVKRLAHSRIRRYHLKQ